MVTGNGFRLLKTHLNFNLSSDTTEISYEDSLIFFSLSFALYSFFKCLSWSLLNHLMGLNLLHERHFAVKLWLKQWRKYAKPNVNVQVDFCESSPCQNGGVCNPLEAGHSCACPQGYSGRNCEFFGYDCDSDPCQNGGSCQPLDAGGYFCHCPPG